MSITAERTMTEKNLTAHRRNARKSRGPATAKGKERVRDAKLRHGFYSKDRDTALLALGEDPKELDAVAKAVRQQWQPANGFEELMVLRLERAVWRMNRADRMQEGHALRQAKELNDGREDRLHAQMMNLRVTEASLQTLAQSVAQEHYVTTPADLELIKSLHEEGAVKEMGAMAIGLFYQLQEPGAPGPGEEDADQPPADPYAGVREAMRVVTEGRAMFGLKPFTDEELIARGTPPPPPLPRPGQPEAGANAEDAANPYSDITEEEWQAREAPRQLLQNILTRQLEQCQARRLFNLRDCMKGPTTYERAAEIAPDSHAQLMQRMEDSNFRQFWRLTNLLLKLKRQTAGRGGLENRQESGNVTDK
jgi:hypothetical protein